MAADRFLQEKLATLSERMLRMKRHPVFSMVRSIQDLRLFMQWHVFAVWDFMSLVKRLQRDLTCVTLPWLPPKSPKASRLINEIVLGEETDEIPAGGHASHFELYLMAMKEVGASTKQIEQFIALVDEDNSIEQALKQLQVEPAIASFVQSTICTACYGATAEVLGSFFYGREDVIPEMFRYLLKTWAVDPAHAPMFVYYLDRHIALDAESHGPAAQMIIQEMLRDDKQAWQAMLNSAHVAVDQRMKLWNALAVELENANEVVVI